MADGQKGIVAAGHPLTAQAGARVLREGGNAVDAALAAMLTSFAAEPLLTGLGAGGYMLVAGAGQQPTLLDFFVQAPRERQGRRGGSRRRSGARRWRAAGRRRVVRRRGSGLLHRPGLVRGVRGAGRRVRGGRALGHDPAGAARGAGREARA